MREITKEETSPLKTEKRGEDCPGVDKYYCWRWRANNKNRKA